MQHRRRPMRSGLESLEPRRLFSTLSGTLFADPDADGLRDAGEPALSGWTVFLDANNNGLLDPAEATAITDAAGGYSFPTPTQSNYTVAALAQNGWTQTGPIGGAVPGKTINVSKFAGNQADATIAIDPSNPSRLVAASYVGTGLGFFLATSTDAGATWAGRVVANGLDSLTSGCCDPSVAFDDHGNLFLAYMNQNATAIAMAVSTNGGQTLAPLATFAGNIDQPTVVAANDAVWVTYWSGGDIVAAGAPVAGLGSIGAFNAPQTAPNSNGNFGDIAIGPNGQVMVTYQNRTGQQGNAQIYVNVDPDGLGPLPFGPRITATSTEVGGFDYIPAQSTRSVDAEAGLAWDRSGGPHHGRVYLVYTDEAPAESNDLDIYVRYSDNNGATWSNRIRVNDDATTRSQFLPKIALDQTTGAVGVVFYDARNDPNNTDIQIYGATITNGATVSPNFRISTGTSNAAAAQNGLDFGDTIGLAFHAGSLYPLWTDNSNSTGDNPDGTRSKLDLYTNRIRVVPPTQPAPQSRIAGPTEPAVAHFAFRPPTTFTGTTGPDTYTLRITGQNLEILANSPTPTYTIPTAALTSLTFNTLDGDDTVIVIVSSPIPAPVSLNTGPGRFTLDIRTGATLTLANAGPKALTIESLLLAGTLDAGDHDLILPGASYDTIRQHIAAGRLTSTISQAARLAPVDNNMIRQTSWEGVPLAGLGQVIVKRTIAGDVDLDGLVTAADSAAVVANMNRPGHWIQGDADLDGLVTLADFNLVQSNLGATSPPPPAASFATAEPIAPREDELLQPRRDLRTLLPNLRPKPLPRAAAMRRA